MGSSLPQHAQFKVVKKYDTGGIISPEASVRYGPTTKNPMLIFRDNCVLFADDRLYNKYSDRIESARPVNTRMKEITLKMPLADIPEGELKVITDGKTFIKVQDEGITELIQVKNELLTPENLSKPSQIIKAENGWKTDRIKKDKE